jgi:hypothetical protein
LTIATEFRLWTWSPNSRLERDGRTLGFFVTFDFTSDAIREVKRYERERKRIIVPKTVRQILEEEGSLMTSA